MGCNISDCFKKRLCCWVKDPRKSITYAWLASLILVIIACIVAIISAVKMSKTGGAGNAASFCAMWTSLLLIVISIVGSVIMRKYKGSMAIGAFLGVIFIMCNQMLILFGIFVERSQVPGEPLPLVQSQQAMVVFAWFLFTVYFLFGSLLFVFRHDIMEDENTVPVNAL